MILGPILDHIFGPKKDNLFCPVFVFRRSMSNAICDHVLYLQSEYLNIPWAYPGTIPFQYLKMVFAIQYSPPSLTGSQFIFQFIYGSVWENLKVFWCFRWYRKATPGCNGLKNYNSTILTWKREVQNNVKYGPQEKLDAFIFYIL